MLEIVALISGGGSILKALLEACDDASFPAKVVAVGSDTEATGLDHAKTRNIPTFMVAPKKFESRHDWGVALLEQVRAHGVATPNNPGLILSAGLMRILPEAFVAEVSPFLINTHPALLPFFPGANAVADAVAAGVSETGVTVHIIDAGVDTGPVLRQAKVDVLEGESVAELHERIKEVERPLLIEVVRDIATNKLSLTNVSTSKGE